MKAQVNYVCWSSDVVTATIPTEAATPSKAVLLATHSPLRITRRGGKGGHDASEFVSERQVLDEFLTAPPNNGVLVAIVRGESGTGKSHLVRWVDANIAEQPGRHVIYLQKIETSLKDVIEKLLLEQEDPEFEDIRRRVSSLGSGMTLEEMKQRILAELAEALRTANSDTPLGKALVGENGLSLFFLDPLFRKHLLRSGSFVGRRAEYALYGRAADEPDVPLEFTVGELPLDIADHANILDAAAATQKLFRRLVGNAGMQGEAVRLLNELLDIAVMKAASLNVGDISQAFMKIREKLVGQEIVLLIEDVALIQGVRRDLLDAIVEVGVVQGVRKYATVRTMMAVTPGYYHESLPETFRFRAEASSPVYEVDVDLDGDGADEQDLIGFVGRYLNAARVGKEALEAASPEVPNACSDCGFQPSCHAAFGASRQEYGLYPYNKAAILRAVRACAERDRVRGRVVFNPRRVLSRAVRDVLSDNVEVIEGGRFPAGAFLAEESAAMGLLHLPTHVRERIETDYSGEEAGRLEALVTFWGRAGTEPIDDGILEAFSHQAIPAGIFDIEGEDEEEDRGKAGNEDEGRNAGKNGGKNEVPRSVLKQIDDIDAWSQRKPLPQGIAGDLRSIVREALLARIDWLDTVIKEPDSQILSKAVPSNARGISIDGASENLPLAVEPIVRIERNARMAMMFRGLVYIKAGYPQRAGDALPRLDAIVSERVDEARRRILAASNVDDASLVAGAASLIRGAAACGVIPAKPKDLDYVNACLWRDATSGRADASARAPEWLAAYQDYVAAREKAVERLLSGAGAAQGSGAIHAVDIQRLTAIVRKAQERAASEDELEVPDWCEEANRKLKALTRASARQVAHWQSLTDRVRTHLPEGVTLTETVDAIVDAVKMGQGHGLVKVPNLQALSGLNDEARSWDAASIAAVERLLTSARMETGMSLLSTVGTIAGADLPRIASYLESSAQWVEAGIQDAESDGGTAADIDAQLEETIKNWFEIVEEPMTRE